MVTLQCRYRNYALPFYLFEIMLRLFYNKKNTRYFFERRTELYTKHHLSIVSNMSALLHLETALNFTWLSWTCKRSTLRLFI